MVFGALATRPKSKWMPSCSPTAETGEKAASALPSPPNFCRETSGRPSRAFVRRFSPVWYSNAQTYPHRPTRLSLTAKAGKAPEVEVALC